jgi:transcriptional regulator GlxA family with amidase domain
MARSRGATALAPVSAGRRVVMLAYEDADLLDVAGPVEVFAVAAQWLRHRGSAPGYAVEVVASRPGALRTGAGLRLLPHRALREVRGPIDTLLVAGGIGTPAALADARLVAWLRATARRVRRIASICSGAFLLAEAGLLDGRRATTHWSVGRLMAERYPRVRVETDPIFVRDGRVWTSAGVTAGIDLSLALVEEDCGREAALAVARQLVVFLQRPGGQSQFSAQLRAQAARREPLREVQSWVADAPAGDLSVAALARRAAMSPRHFARVFAREVGTTPARYVERARVEAARRSLESTARGVEEVAAECGFGSAEIMRRAFQRTVRVSPAAYRSRFRAR